MNCGCGDPVEYAIADNWIIFPDDLDSGEPTTYDTPEHEQMVKDAQICPIRLIHGFNPLSLKVYSVKL